jgi:hypothetical protein
MKRPILGLNTNIIGLKLCEEEKWHGLLTSQCPLTGRTADFGR